MATSCRAKLPQSVRLCEYCMAIFRNEPDDLQRLDWLLLQNGAVTLYFRPQVLVEDVEWLKGQDYRVDSFECSVWVSESQMHEALSRGLEFPAYYGRNLNALNDCISDIEIPEDADECWYLVDMILLQQDFLMSLGPFSTSWKLIRADCFSLVND